MTVFIFLTVLLLLVFGIPNRRMIPEEYRKRFFRINTAIYALFAVPACIFWLTAIHHSNSWDELGYAFLSAVFYFGGALELVISWLISALIQKRRQRESTR